MASNITNGALLMYSAFEHTYGGVIMWGVYIVVNTMGFYGVEVTFNDCFKNVKKVLRK